MKLYTGKLSLTSKLSIIVTTTVLLVLLLLGFYFDNFLKDSFLSDTQKRLQHAHSRIASNLRDIEQELKEGVTFVRTDQGIIASIELINNYQDKNNYNTLLLDEEKKHISDELLSRVKLSFNSDTAIYDHNEELVAFVVKQGRHYKPHFISFASGERQLYSRYEEQTEFGMTPFQLPNNLKSTHVSYYAADHNSSNNVITYQQFNDQLIIRSHQNLIDPDSGRGIGHIEMSKILDKAYFKQLSEDLGIDVSLTFNADFQLMAQPLGENRENSLVKVHQTEEEYIGVMSHTANNRNVYFITKLNKMEQKTVLNDNRQRFLLLLVFVATATLLLMRYLFYKGLAQPLALLMGQIDKIEKQDYSNSESLNTNDELEAISSSIIQLAVTVQKRETSLELSQKELQYLSNHDPLTNLPNRRYFSDCLNHSLELAKRKGDSLAVFFLDLDQFKIVNDTLGHDVGDELIVQVAERLRENIRSTEILARLGGDEFIILLESPQNLYELEVVASKYLELFRQPFSCRNNEISTTVSIGISIYPDDGNDSVTIIKNADLAMYNSKGSGRNSYSFFSKKLSEQVSERADMVRGLKDAITAGNQFVLHYQPKISMQSGKIEAVEALIRWQSPDYGFVAPDQFIPLAEETGVIVPIGEWVLQQGCKDFMQLQQEGVKLNHISINVSNIQMRHCDMTKVLSQAIEETGIQPNELELEITESYIATDIGEALNILEKIRNMGISLSVDDFGTGYSSMSYLKKLPVSRIKVDKSFIDGIPHDQDSIAITRAIINLAKSLDLKVTVEGVEHEEQMSFLKNEDCDEIQGYYFAKPLTLPELRNFYRQQMGEGNVVSFDDSFKNSK